MSERPFANPPSHWPPVVIRRSARRRKTIQARWEAGTIVVAVPGHFGSADESKWVPNLVERLLSKARRNAGEEAKPDDLMERARRISERFLDGRVTPRSVRWVSNQNTRWGSATPSRGSIRLSDKLRSMPDWVIDHVLLHELAHFVELNHGPRFRQLLAADPRAAEATAFLAGVSFAQQRDLGKVPTDSEPDDDIDVA